MAAAAAATAGTALYLDGKYGIRKDLRGLRIQRNTMRMYMEAGEFSIPLNSNNCPINYLSVKRNRVSLYYFFEESVKRKPNDECIWSRDGCYTWQQTYDRVHQFAQWFLQQGVQPGDLVSFYLTNSAEFLMAWLGLWAIGAAPAMINYHLAGKALLHCLKVSGAKLVLVDEDKDVVARIEDERANIEAQLGMNILVLDAGTKEDVRAMKAERPGDEFRKGVKGDWPMSIFYTRSVNNQSLLIVDPMLI